MKVLSFTVVFWMLQNSKLRLFETLDKKSPGNKDVFHVRAVRSPLSEILPPIVLLEENYTHPPMLKEIVYRKRSTFSPDSKEFNIISFTITESVTNTDPGEDSYDTDVADFNTTAANLKSSTTTKPISIPRTLIMNSSTYERYVSTSPTTMKNIVVHRNQTIQIRRASKNIKQTTSYRITQKTLTPSSTIKRTTTGFVKNERSLNNCLKEVEYTTATTDAMYSALLLLEKTMDCSATCRKACFITKDSCVKKETSTTLPSSVDITTQSKRTTTPYLSEILIHDYWLPINFTRKKNQPRPVTRRVTISEPLIIRPDAIASETQWKQMAFVDGQQYICEHDDDCSQLREPAAFCNWNSWTRPYKGAPLSCKCRNNYCVTEIYEATYIKWRYCFPKGYFCPEFATMAPFSYPSPPIPKAILTNSKGRYFPPGPTASLVRCRNDFDCQKCREPQTLCDISYTLPRIQLLSEKCHCDDFSHYCLLEFKKPDLLWTFCVMQTDYHRPCDNPPLILTERKDTVPHQPIPAPTFIYGNPTNSQYFPIDQGTSAATQCSSDHDCLFLREPLTLCEMSDDGPPYIKLRKRHCYCDKRKHACIMEFYKLQHHWTFCVKPDTYQSRCYNKPLIKPAVKTIIQSRPVRPAMQPVFTIFDRMKYPQMRPAKL